jgi:hypothetical protein
MSRFLLIFLTLLSAVAAGASGQTGSAASEPTNAMASANARLIDGVAARIEDDIITESEVRELAAFQTLVDGHAKSRPELIQELADQWIAEGEARVAYYPQPSEEDVNLLFEQLQARFSSPDEFQKRAAEVGLTQSDIRRLLAKQLYLSRFLDYRFRPAAQVDQKQIEAYYNDQLVPELKQQGQPVPPLADVQDAIEEVLVQRVITDRASAWLKETRARLKVDILDQGERP